MSGTPWTFVLTTRDAEFSRDWTIAEMLSWCSQRGYFVHSMPTADTVNFWQPGTQGVALIVKRYPLCDPEKDGA